MPNADKDTPLESMAPPITCYVVREAREVRRESGCSRLLRHEVQQKFEHITGTVLTVSCVPHEYIFGTREARKGAYRYWSS